MIPDRVKMWWTDSRSRWAFRPALRLPPVRVCDGEANAEVHLMTGRTHLRRSIAALKLFFHHVGGAAKTGLVIHLDGTVGRSGCGLLRRHFPGVRFTDVAEWSAGARQLLETYPSLAAYCRRRTSVVHRLVQIAVSTRSPRLVMLDSDVIFTTRPPEVVDWIESPAARPYYLINRFGTPAEMPQSVADDLLDATRNMPSLGGAVGLIREHFSAGLLLLPTDRFSLAAVDQFCRWMAGPRPGYWFQDWNLDQTILSLMYSAWPDASPFDERYQCGATPGAVCSHYLGGTLYRPETLAAVRSELLRLARPAAGG